MQCSQEELQLNEKKYKRRKRKKWADLTEEQRIKRIKGNRKWRNNLSEEKRQKLYDYNRIKKRNELTDDQRLKKLEYNRERRAYFTEEQRQKHRESQRKWRSNLTKEKREQLLEYNRKWRENLTEDQKMKYKEHKRLDFVMTEEEQAKKLSEKRKKFAEYHRRYRANLSKEQHQKNLEYERKKYANFTAEQRKRRAETKRRRIANFTEEQRKLYRERCIMNSKRRYANLSDEKRKQFAEAQRIRFAKSKEKCKNEIKSKWITVLDKSYSRSFSEINDVIDTQCQKIYNIKYEQHCKKRSRFIAIDDKENEYDLIDTHDEKVEYIHQWRNNFTKDQIKKCILSFERQNPLKNLICQVIQNNIDTNIITELNQNLFRRILQMFEINYPRDILLQDEFTKQYMDYEIDVKFLTELLIKWNGWTSYDSITRLMSIYAYEDLYFYLSDNLRDVDKLRNNKLYEELDEYFFPENYINISCSLKQLQETFYHRPHQHKTYYRDDIDASPTYLQSSGTIPRYIFNWPFISTQISLPNFSIIHQNVNIDEFHLTNITNEFKIKIKEQNMELFMKMTTDKSDTFTLDFIIEFLNQFKNIVENNKDDISSEMKTELVNVITEFEKDIGLCCNTIETNAIYYLNLNPYPYIRYIDHPDIDTNEDETINVRLQQISEPKMMFIMTRFNFLYEDVNDGIRFVFDDTFYRNVNNCILYKCLLCDENLAMKTMLEHFTKYHGFEPDWKCVKCANSFSTNHLCLHRWWHRCDS